MKVEARAGDLVLDFLYKHTGEDNDQLTASFYELNPHVRGDFFIENTWVIVPEATNTNNNRVITRSWD